MRRLLQCLALQVPTPAGLLLVAVAAAALADSLLVVEGTFQPFNHHLTAGVYPVEPHWLDLLMIPLTYLGSDIPMIAITLGITVRAHRGGRPRLARIFLGTAIFGRIALTLLKLLVQEPRPFLRIPPYPLLPLYDYGYPSGHAMMALVVFGFGALVVWRMTPRPAPRGIALAAALLLIAGIGFSRVYLGLHWANDVLGGYLYGALLLLTAYLLDRCQATPERP